MAHYDLTSSNWMLVRLAIVVLDVAAVAFIVWLFALVMRWRRRLMARIGKGMRQNQRNKPRLRGGVLSSATRLSKPTASHPSLR